MSKHQLIILDGQRRRGRPRVEEPRSSVSTWIPAEHHDRLVQTAHAKEMSVSALVRQIITKSMRVE